ncbi:hypothetical protein IV38_GL000958 [Lactobacillus selangorensis]|uniref:Uncharacterized protein n=1 Tax=Lactobacillus selangorensis TaxID=81857 RepID=A0A0R2FJA6_9LACO|nr:hypothetical protein [Lactobacillus selangorensis]KRN28753.1 hypothetical protein IV38_GL000958 [Lactobacillus selangorensis]KRN32837.1 hypothetical protein IV40_GL000895 [Lactobacillus selangorensis]
MTLFLKVLNAADSKAEFHFLKALPSEHGFESLGRHMSDQEFVEKRLPLRIDITR